MRAGGVNLGIYGGVFVCDARSKEYFPVNLNRNFVRLTTRSESNPRLLPRERVCRRNKTDPFAFRHRVCTILRRVQVINLAKIMARY